MHNHAGSTSASILIISNDRATVQAAMCGLPSGYTAAVAYDLPAALIQLDCTSFDLIISEIRLPESNGPELLARLTASADAGVIFAFSSRDWALALETLRLGAYDCLEKPARENIWRTRMSEACHRRRREQDERAVQQLLKSPLQECTEYLQNALTAGDGGRRDTLSTLVMALDRRENALHMHSLRVQAFSVLLARHCGYDPAGLDSLSRGALLHDIGKIAIPDQIILKPGPLTPEEARIIRQHPLLGHQMISSLPNIHDAADIALRHHERVDGGGYPYGLRGDEIPLSARIFSVADALDVMLSGRTYCAPRTLEDAQLEMLECAGTQFDAEVVDVFLDIPGEAWFAAQDQVQVQVQVAAQPPSDNIFVAA